MKKLHLAIGAALALSVTSVTIGAVHEADSALRTLPATVQGVDYRSTLASEPEGVTFAPQGDLVPARNASTFSFDDIQFWAGEGSNRAALVVQWNCDGEETALVFGYRWDGRASGSTLVRAIAEAHPRFYAMLQYTNVSSDLDPNGGYTINGLGWDADDDGDIYIVDSSNGNIYTTETGYFDNNSGSYNYDNMVAGDKDDFWQAGWYIGYWSYWIGTSPTSLSYSSVGASGREITDGSWDFWNYAVNMVAPSMKDLEAAPNTTPAGAKTEFVNEGLCYSLVNYAKSTVSVSAPFEGQAAYSGEITIPSTFVDNDTTYTVVGVGAQAFAGSEVTKVTLPTSVATLADEAFKGSKLAEINVTDAVTKLGKEVFAGCPLKEIYVPASITAIPDGAYSGAVITSFTVPSHVTSIGASAFANCEALETVELHNQVATIGASAFAGCDKITSVTVPHLYPPVITDDVFSETAYAEATLQVPMDVDALYKEATGWKNFATVKTIGVEVPEGTIFSSGSGTYKVLPTAEGEEPQVKVSYAKPDGTANLANIKTANTEFYTGDVVIPAEVSFQGKTYKVTSLSDSCFLYAPATSITLPDAITEIPKYGFYHASIESVKLPANLTTIGNRAFDYCQKLTSVELPAGVTSLPQYLFNYCTSLKSVTSASPIQSMDYYAFYSCTALETIPELAEGMTKIPQAAFGSCSSLTSVKLPSTITEIGGSAFQNCKSLVIDFPENVTSLGTQVFGGCTSLTSMTINDKLTEIPANTFNGCTSLTEINIPANIKTIGNYALANTGITEFELPETVTKLGTFGFYNCSKLTKVVIPSTISTVPGNTFNGCTVLTDVQFKNPNVTTIDTYAFNGCKALTSVKFGVTEEPAEESGDDDDSLDEAKTSAEAPAYGITIPSTVTTIGTYAFQNCSSLTFNPEMPAKLTSIGTYAFDGCSLLTELELPEGFKTFGTYCFRNTALKELVIPSTVTTVANYLCNGTTSLHLYFLSETPASVSANTFAYATGKYVAITVPSGTAAAYYAKSTYYKTASAAEPGLDVTFGEASVNDGDGLIVVTSDHDVAYADDSHPTRFTDANASFLENAKVTLRVTPVVEEEVVDDPEPTPDPEAGEDDGDDDDVADISAQADEADETDDNSSEVEATLSNGKLSAEFEADPDVKVYTGTWVYNLGTTTTESEPFRIEVSSSAIASITETADVAGVAYADGILTITGHEGDNVAIITIDGRVVKTARCASAREQVALDLPAATYVVVIGNQALKIAIK